MVGRRKNRHSDERLDRFGRQVVRAAASNVETAEAVASSPFLYTRLRSRIAAERERRESVERWLALPVVAWRAVPVLALVAVIAFALFLSARLDTQSARGLTDEALLDVDNIGIERVVFIERRTAMSRDEILETILNNDEREDVK